MAVPAHGRLLARRSGGSDEVPPSGGPTAVVAPYPGDYAEALVALTIAGLANRGSDFRRDIDPHNDTSACSGRRPRGGCACG